jgi:GntR family transcriptional regulator / MocR family aminotransferase
VVKRAAGWFIQAQTWDDEQGQPDARPWRVRIHDRLLQAIRDGQLPPGSRLPSARQLALEWGVSRGTVDEAFAWLQADGHIERHVGVGSVVAHRSPANLPQPAPTPARREPNAATLRALSRLKPISDDPSDFPLHGQRGLRLRPQMSDVSQFPLALWRRLVAQAYHETRRDRLSYGAAAGTFELRSATVQHLALTRGLHCSPRQVIIIESALQAIGLVAQVLLEPGAEVCVCEPGHISTPRFLSLLHMQVHGIAPDAQGFDVQAARRMARRPAAVLLQPDCQYPVGTRMSRPRRQELLQWADETGAWIFEHEFLAEVAFDTASPPTLFTEDQHESVLLLGGYSPIMFPSLRLAYLVVPERLAGAFAAVRGMLGDHSPVAPQLALAQFIEGGHMAAHVRAMRELYTGRRQALLAALQRHPALAAQVQPAPAGLNACLLLPPTLLDVSLLPALAARGVAPGTLSTHARQAGLLNGLVLGFGADDEAQIVGAVEELALVHQAAAAAAANAGS